MISKTGKIAGQTFLGTIPVCCQNKNFLGKFTTKNKNFVSIFYTNYGNITFCF